MWTQNCVVIPAVIEYCITNQDIIDRCDTQDILNYVIKQWILRKLSYI